MALKIEVREIGIPLVHPFETSFGRMETSTGIVVKIEDEDGNIGWGEAPVEEAPGYCYETTETAMYILSKFLVPIFKSFDSLPEIETLLSAFGKVRGHEFAKGGIEAAYWSYKAAKERRSLGHYYGSTRSKIPTGVSIGIQPNIDSFMKRVGDFVDQGYKRIKIKIKPGWDYEPVDRIRKEFGDIKLMVDANSAYSLNDRHIEQLKKLDRFELMMIEQPLSYQDLLMHKRLQKVIETPICLDESIHSVEDAIYAVEEECCRIVNIKPGRVGGFYNSIQIAKSLGHDKVWCGGMLEAGIGRIHNIFLQARDEFTLPGDTSGSNRYYKEDIINPEVIVNDGYINVPNGPNLGVEVKEDRLDSVTRRKVVL